MKWTGGFCSSASTTRPASCPSVATRRARRAYAAPSIDRLPHDDAAVGRRPCGASACALRSEAARSCAWSPALTSPCPSTSAPAAARISSKGSRSGAPSTTTSSFATTSVSKLHAWFVARRGGEHLRRRRGQQEQDDRERHRDSRAKPGRHDGGRLHPLRRGGNRALPGRHLLASAARVKRVTWRSSRQASRFRRAEPGKDSTRSRSTGGTLNTPPPSRFETERTSTSSSAAIRRGPRSNQGRSSKSGSAGRLSGAAPERRVVLEDLNQKIDRGTYSRNTR